MHCPTSLGKLISVFFSSVPCHQFHTNSPPPEELAWLFFLTALQTLDCVCHTVLFFSHLLILGAFSFPFSLSSPILCGSPCCLLCINSLSLFLSPPLAVPRPGLVRLHPIEDFITNFLSNIVLVAPWQKQGPGWEKKILGSLPRW